MQPGTVESGTNPGHVGQPHTDKVNAQETWSRREGLFVCDLQPPLFGLKGATKKCQKEKDKYKMMSLICGI